MTETYIATAEEELASLREWLNGFDATVEGRVIELVTEEITRRLVRIQGGQDGWRYRCLAAEKRNAELIDELRRVREELNDLKYREVAPQ